ncbi:MAG TPA: hypothetical protein VKC34_01575 [Blastocatellia bacterium]|nr:hypothetical protein [Blastocatellia bacterium]
MRRTVFAILLIAVSMPGSPSTRKATAQTVEHTLAGEWVMTSSPINGATVSRMGNSLGFPERDMLFEQEGDLRSGVVLREDVGQNVRPLGSWRVRGDRFSAAFQLWCPQSDQPCGSVIMRGTFLDESRVRGTMTVFFDEKDSTRPTGYDTWIFSFRGNRVSGGSN